MAKKACELCSSPARMFCESDQASLCWDCDEKVHVANFLVAKHTRAALCQVCHSPTPWKASGPSIGRTISVCGGCICRSKTTGGGIGGRKIEKVGRDAEEEEEGKVVTAQSAIPVISDERRDELHGEYDRHDGDDDGSSGAGDADYDFDSCSSDDYDDDDDDCYDDDDENQVVPWTSTPAPPPATMTASTSSSEEEEPFRPYRFCGGGCESDSKRLCDLTTFFRSNADDTGQRVPISSTARRSTLAAPAEDYEQEEEEENIHGCGGFARPWKQRRVT